MFPHPSCYSRMSHLPSCQWPSLHTRWPAKRSRFLALSSLYPLLTLGFLKTSLKPCAKAAVPATKKKRSRLFCSYCKKANHTVDTCRLVPGTITIQGGGGQMAPTGCTFRIATGRAEKKEKQEKQ
ncbi:uncharacterized protein FMAN_02855 [Fusarium mangiferae]|uniref:Uncharacterized protein n=1 Tax=Fusarium mangiferae TaxID=192010 RepID=A0A1L7T6B0_FUSMA|nr:uncharacterized protein FMAN_02855 [Fusarium mangiferae]CVK93469.1 uncharacterized protein FMAN_02855 [Fusarium mangiferae]